MLLLPELLLPAFIMPRLLHKYRREVPDVSSCKEVYHHMFAFSMVKTSQICTCRHLPAFHPVAFPTTFQKGVCWCLHRLLWWERCSSVCRVLVLHHQHLSFSQCQNRFRHFLVGGCLLLSLQNLVATDFTRVIGKDLLVLVLAFSD